MKTKFFTESSSFSQIQKEEDDYLYIPKENYSLRSQNQVIRPIELDEYDYSDSDLVYKRTESGSISFSTPRDELPQFFIDPRVQVKMTKNMGMGCFAVEDIAVNTLIESCPVLLLHTDTFENLNKANGGYHKLSEYPFNWGRDGLCAFALGYGGVYNHKPFPNVAWRPSYEMESIQYVTKEDIKSGSQLFIRYLPLTRMELLWFSDPDSEEYVKNRGHDLKQTMGILSTWSLR